MTSPSGRSRSWIGRLLALALLVSGVALTLIAPYAVTLIRSQPALARGLRAADHGLEAAHAGDVGCAARLLEIASEELAQARSRLGAWWNKPAGLLPLIGRHTRAVEVVAAAAADVAAPAAEALRRAADPGLSMSSGAVDTAALHALGPPLVRTVSALEAALTAIRRVSSDWLVPGAGRRLDQAALDLGRALEGSRTAAEIGLVLPALFGADAPRRYFVAIQNPSEQRASGGIIGNYAELTFTDGRMDLTTLGRNEDFLGAVAAELASGTPVGPPDFQSRYLGFGPEKFFVNASLSPDFPTVARIIEELYPRFSGRRVDGVISIDPLALAALLELIGPVTLAGWPQPIDSDNAVAVLLHQQYARLSGEAREHFLLRVAQAIFDRLQSADLAAPGIVVRALGPAVRGRHLMVHSAHGSEQRALDAVGLTGAIAPVRGDFVQVVTQNSGQNKIDWFQRRAVSYDATYDPPTGLVRSKLVVRLANLAPSSGLPGYVLGGPGFPVETGHSRTWVSIYSPLGLDGATLDGVPVAPEQETELGRRVYSTFVTLEPGGTSVLELNLTGLIASGPYRLDVGHQPTIFPDRLSVRIVGPPGWATTSLRNLDAGSRALSATVEQVQDRVFEAGFRRGAPLADGPTTSNDAGGDAAPLPPACESGGPT